MLTGVARRNWAAASNQWKSGTLRSISSIRSPAPSPAADEPCGGLGNLGGVVVEGVVGPPAVVVHGVEGGVRPVTCDEVDEQLGDGGPAHGSVDVGDGCEVTEPGHRTIISRS